MSGAAVVVILLGLTVTVMALSRLPARGGASSRPTQRVAIVLGLLAAGLGTAVAVGAFR